MLLWQRIKVNTILLLLLYFKAISALCDIYIFIKEGKTPSNHTERFRILELKYPEIYKIIDKGFSFLSR